MKIKNEEFLSKDFAFVYKYNASQHVLHYRNLCTDAPSPEKKSGRETYVNCRR